MQDAGAKDAFAQAIAHHAAGRTQAAVPLYRAALADRPDHAEANHLLGIILVQQGAQNEACVFLGRASASPDASPEMHNNYGVALNAIGRAAEAAEAFMRAVAARPDYAEALNNLGAVHRDAGRLEDAIAAFSQAIEIQPDYGVAAENLRGAYSEVIPPWHFVMMNDGARNAAYDAAIRRAVAGKRVLDIGTGAGLLAMMAARAGAAEVTTCELVPLIAKAARDIVVRNGFVERITVVGRSSHELAVGRDLSAPADVLVTETFSSGLLGEEILPTIEHAHANLLSPHAQIIPRAASARGYLVGGENLYDKLFVGHAAGFDLAPFGAFAPAKIGLSLDHEPHDVLSDDVTLVAFDLTQRVFSEARVEGGIVVTKPGVCVGLAQWLKLDLDGEATYENRPSAQAGGATWTHIVYRFPRPLRVQAGDIVRIAVRHDRKQISVDLLG